MNYKEKQYTYNVVAQVGFIRFQSLLPICFRSAERETMNACMSVRGGEGEEAQQKGGDCMDDETEAVQFVMQCDTSV